jgi:hypothetical protein
MTTPTQRQLDSRGHIVDRLTGPQTATGLLNRIQAL